MATLTQLLVFIVILAHTEAIQVTLDEKDVFYLPRSDVVPGESAFQFDVGLGEQTAYDPRCRFVYTVGDNVIHVLQLERNLTLSLLAARSFPDTLFTQVQVCGKYVYAVAKDSDQEGRLLIFCRYDKYSKKLRMIQSIAVGTQPDNVVVSKSCKKILVGVEGNPFTMDDGTPVNPEGFITLIEFPSRDLRKASFRKTKIDFSEFDSRATELEAQGLLYGDRDLPLRFDLEPEYICLDSTESRAFVTLQENNAIAVLDLRQRKTVEIFGLGFKDHSLEGQGLDPSDEDSGFRKDPNRYQCYLYKRSRDDIFVIVKTIVFGIDGININTWPVFGIYHPDVVRCLSIGKQTFLITANEGNLRSDEEERIKNLVLHATAFPDAATLQMDANLGRLKVTTIRGDIDGDGEFEELYPGGTRSISLWTSDGMLISDTNDDFAQLLAQTIPELFNANNDEIGADARSDDKGVEHESLVSFCVCGGRYEAVFVGNERASTITIATLDRRNLSAGFTVHEHVDGILVKDGSKTMEELYDERMVSLLDPEGMALVKARFSPTRKPLLIVSAAVSGTVNVFEINVDCEA